MDALPADSFADSFGVVGHVNWWDSVQGTAASVYEDIDAVSAALADLGCRHVRDAFPMDVQRGDALNQVHERSGARFSLVTYWSASAAEYLAAARSYEGALEAIEGCNEPDLFPHITPEEVRSWQRTLAEEIRPHLPGVEVLGTPMCHPHNAHRYGDMSDWMDVGNLHVYARRWPYRAEDLLEHWDLYKVSCGDRPLRVTETGYTAKGLHLQVSERAAASYLTTALLTNLAHGVERTYLYELVDEGRNVADEEYGQNAFGLLTEHFEPKPAYLAIRSLMRLLSDPGPMFDPAPLDVAVTGDGVHSVLFQRRDGTHLLALWTEAQLYEPAVGTDSGTDLHPEPLTARLDLGRAADAEVHAIAGAAVETTALGKVTSAQIDVGPEGPTVVALR